MRKISVLVVSVVVAASLVLVGCASLDAKIPELSLSPTPVLDPVSRIPLSCDQLFPKAEVEQLLGASEGLYTPDDIYSARLRLEQARLTEAGGEECDWVATGTGPDPMQFGLAILPDVSTELSDYQRPLAGDAADAVRNAFGAGSVISCDRSSEPPGCTISVLLADHYWADGYVVAPASVGISDVAKFVSALDERLRSAEASAAPKFKPAPDSFGLRLDCAMIAGSANFKQHPVFGGLGVVQDGDQDSLPLLQLASDRAGATNCTWPYPKNAGSDFDGGVGNNPLTITVTPGGEWYWGTLADIALHGPGLLHSKSIKVLGADQALQDGGTGYCGELALVGHSVVTIATNSLNSTDDLCPTALDALSIVIRVGGA